MLKLFNNLVENNFSKDTSDVNPINKENHILEIIKIGIKSDLDEISKNEVSSNSILLPKLLSDSSQSSYILSDDELSVSKLSNNNDISDHSSINNTHGVNNNLAVVYFLWNWLVKVKRGEF